MKRILSTLVLLTMVLAATAETLKICGTSIDLTKNTTGGTGGVSSGSYDYNYQDKTLTLNKVTITRTVDNNSTNDYGIYSTVKELRIIFNGNCNIQTKASAIYLEAYTHIFNKGTATITSTNNRAIYLKGGDSGFDLLIYGGTWNLTGNHGIEGNKGNDILRLFDTDANYPLKMNVKGTDGSIIDLKELEIPDNFAIVSTIGDEFEFNENEKAVCPYHKSTIVKDRNVIIAQKTFSLGGGIWTTWHPDVNYAARSSISGPGSYPVSYNNSTKTVTLNNATVVPGDGGYLYFEPHMDNMTLNVIGTNTLTPKYDFYKESIRNTLYNLTIKGTGTLNMGPIINGKILDIKDGVTINVTNNLDSSSGILSGDRIRIYNSTLNVNVQSSAVCISSTVELSGSVINSPMSIVVHDNKLYDLDRKTLHKGSLSIVPGTAYDLWVNGVQVNNKNCSNLNGALTGGGSCSYNPDTKTLSLNGAKISYNDGGASIYPAILNNISGLVINNSGTSEIGGDFCGIVSEADLTIKGNGHLKVYGTGQYYGAILLKNCNLTIDNTTLTATGGGIAIYKKGGGIVHLNNSYLNLSGTSEAVAVFSIDSNCEIIKPVRGRIKNGHVFDSNGSYAKEVEIQPKKGIVTTIDAVAPVEEAGETSIYTTSGTLVWQGAGQPQLPRGIYIMKKNGKVQKVQKN